MKIEIKNISLPRLGRDQVEVSIHLGEKRFGRFLNVLPPDQRGWFESQKESGTVTILMPPTAAKAREIPSAKQALKALKEESPSYTTQYILDNLMKVV